MHTHISLMCTAGGSPCERFAQSTRALMGSLGIPSEEAPLRTHKRVMLAASEAPGELLSSLGPHLSRYAKEIYGDQDTAEKFFLGHSFESDLKNSSSDRSEMALGIIGRVKTFISVSDSGSRKKMLANVALMLDAYIDSLEPPKGARS